MNPSPEDLDRLARSYLERQDWYVKLAGGISPGELDLEALTVMRDGLPGLARLELAGQGQRFQLLAGWREPSEAVASLPGREPALWGSLGGASRELLVYDALADDALALELLAVATGGAESAERVRSVRSTPTHESLVFDERLLLKWYRALDEGRRAEVEMVLALDAVGFNAMLAPVAYWSEAGRDLALVREFQSGALECRELALTSLRDLLGDLGSAVASEEPFGVTLEGPELGPEEALRRVARAGGDLGSEMRRLGATTAALHLALAEAFGERQVDPDELAAVLRLGPGPSGRPPAEDLTPLVDHEADLARLVTSRTAKELGRSIRLHGDYHLRRMMRSEAGWLVTGFGDEIPPESSSTGTSSGRRFGTVLEDLADLCWSIGAVAAEALAARSGGSGGTSSPSAPAARSGSAPRALGPGASLAFGSGDTAGALAAGWARHNREAFLAGYAGAPGASRLLPVDPDLTEWILGRLERAREERYEATVSP